MELFPTLQISRRDRSIPSLGGLYRQAHFFPSLFFFFQAEDGIRDIGVTGVQTCALPISFSARRRTFEGLSTSATYASPRTLLLRYERKANFVPSGDHTGESSEAGSKVSRRVIPRPRSIIQIGRASCRERV